jgi:hypothetical protein
MEDAKDDFQFLISFVLAGFVALSVNLWNVRRSNYASLCGAARNMNILLNSLLPFDTNNTALMQTRVRCSRYVMLAMEFSVLKARGYMDSEEGYNYLLDEKLIENRVEWDAMVAGDRHSSVFYWLMVEVVNLKEANVICPEYVVLLSNAISNMRAQANDLMSSLDRDKPISYVALCGLLVNINVLIMSTWKAVNWSAWLHKVGPHVLFRESRIYIDILFLFMWNISYTALYEVGCQLYNPFGNRRIDIAHEVIFSGIRKLSTELSVNYDLRNSRPLPLAHNKVV